MRRRDLLATAPIAMVANSLGSSLSSASAQGGAHAGIQWPMFRGNQATGVADGFSLPEQWRVLWKSPVPGLGHSSPIVWNDRLYVATAVSADGEAPLRLGLFGDRDAAEEKGEQSWIVMCFDKRSGKLLWEKTATQRVPRAQRHMKATQANTSLTTDGEKLVAFFGSEGLYCYTLDGNLLWSKDLGTIDVSKYGVGWGFSSSPAVYKNTIVLQCDAPAAPFIAAFNLANGEELWRTARKDLCERSWATPYVHHEGELVQVVANGWPYVISYDIETGRELWRLKGGGDNPIPTPFASNGYIFVANGHGSQSPVWAIRPQAVGDISLSKGEVSNEHIAWSNLRNGAYISTPLVYRDLLYSVANNGILRCYDAKDGTLHYQQRMGTETLAISASPVAGDGKVYWTMESGDVFVLAAGTEYRELTVQALGDTAMATPAISEGTIYFRTRHELIAVG